MERRVQHQVCLVIAILVNFLGPLTLFFDYKLLKIYIELKVNVRHKNMEVENKAKIDKFYNY